MIGSKCDGLASQRDYFTWNDRFCDISPRWQFQPVPFAGTPILRGALFADVFSDLLCRMEAAANGIGCVDSHTGGVLPFQPLFFPGPVCTGKERCRKKKTILAGAQPLNFGHKALFISFLNVRLDQTQPVDVPSCPDGKKRLRYWNHG